MNLLFLCASILFQDPVAPPAEPPPVQRGLRISEAGAFDGYTLFSPLQSGTTFLIDMKGNVVHRWDTKLAPGNMAYLYDNGNLLRGVRIDDNPRFFGGGLAGRLQELDWDGKVVWDYSLSNDQRVLHHDIEVMPNGHLLVVAWQGFTREQAIALGRDPKATSDKGWWPDEILELEPVRPNDAKIVWEWRMQDHLVQDFDKTKPNYGSPAEHAELMDINADHRNEPPMTKAQREEKEKRDKEMRALGYTGGDDKGEKDAKDGERKLDPDWMHVNGIDYEPSLDLIVFSSPEMCELFVIDHSATTAEAATHAGGKRGHGGDLLWRWGNPMHYGAGAKTDQRNFYQHDPQWVTAPGSREVHVTYFNNGMDRPAGKFSSVEELALPFDAARGFVRDGQKPYGPADFAWHYQAPEPESLYSFFISGATRLPNGDTLICVGAAGRFLEVTREGKTVWEYWNPYGGEIPHSMGNAAPPPEPGRKSPLEPVSVFQATRIAKDHPGLRGRTLNAEANAR
jgi:hypothetical protein